VALAFGAYELRGHAQDSGLRRVQARQKSALLRQNRIQEAASVDGRLVIKTQPPQSVVQTLDGLARRAPAVLLGTFSAGSAKVADNDVVVSDYQFTIEEVLKSDGLSFETGKNVTVLIPGGRASFQNGAYAEVIPLFLLPLKAERFVAFLTPDDPANSDALRPLFQSWSLYQLGAKGTVIPHSASTGVARTVHGMPNEEFLRLVREKLKG
jgi:hypothetical protein